MSAVPETVGEEGPETRWPDQSCNALQPFIKAEQHLLIIVSRGGEYGVPTTTLYHNITGRQESQAESRVRYGLPSNWHPGGCRLEPVEVWVWTDGCMAGSPTMPAGHSSPDRNELCLTSGTDWCIMGVDVASVPYRYVTGTRWICDRCHMRVTRIPYVAVVH